MDWQFPLASLPSLLAGLFQAVLAIVLLRVGRGRRPAVALALLLSASACASVMVVVFGGFSETYPMAVAMTVTFAFWAMDGWLWAGFAMMLLAERTRVPRVLQSFPTFVLPAVAIALLGLLKPGLVWDFSGFLSAPLAEDAPPGSFPFGHPQALYVVDRLSDLATPAFALLLAWWALRRELSEEWSSILVIALAAGGIGAFSHATNVDLLSGRDSTAWTLMRILALAGSLGLTALFGMLVHDGFRGRVERRGLARAGAVFLIVMAAGGMWIGFAPSTPLAFSTFLALSTLTFPLVATYALLRHRLLGLDVKLRFAISRSTIAAAFIAAFFLASEGAQILFGQGNEWVGLLGAGALVFALAPLQRAAERLAERAVPVSPRATTAEGNQLTAYRIAVEAALRNDGRLTAREEAHLADLAQALGVGAGDAHRLRREVEATAIADGREGR